MKIVCAPDSFKESMTAAEAAAALAEGIHRVLPEAECVEVPMADGGEGFTEALAAALGAHAVEVPLRNALGEPATGQIAVGDGVAVLDVAQAVGLGMVPPEKRRIREMTSFGVGQLILAALDAGASEILVGLGGSGTNDGGAGMLIALGARLLDESGAELDGSPSSLTKLTSIDLDGLDPRLSQTAIKIACDVDNPLLGPRGASAIYGPQKGASDEDVEFLDGVLHSLAEAAGHLDSAAEISGAGAAGGLGYAFAGFLGAELKSGVDLVMEKVGLESALEGADLVFTGEGAIDRQTLMGKTLSGVARLARERGLPVIAFAGKIGEDSDVLYEYGFAALVPIVDSIVSLEEALANGRENLARAAERTARLVVVGEKLAN